MVASVSSADIHGGTTDERAGIPDIASHDVVRSLYRVFLDREPDEAGLAHHAGRLKRQGLDLVLQDFIASPEFGLRQVEQAPAFVAMNFQPPMPVQPTAAPDEIDRLWRHIASVWSSFGDDDPLWSVLTDDRYRTDGALSSQARDRFYASGKNDVTYMDVYLARAGMAGRRFPTIAEYGCGVGRVTPFLARRCDTIRAFDISPSHLDLAATHLRDEKVTNAELVHVAGRDDLAGLQGIDLFFSIIVLQHNPPPIILDVLDKAFAGLNPGGVAFFQVPLFATGYGFSLAQYWDGVGARREMELHFVPQRDIFDVAEAHGLRLLETRQDHCLGRYKDMISHTYLMQKRG